MQQPGCSVHKQHNPPLKTSSFAYNANSIGSLDLDLALGTGGFTFSRMVEVSGEPGVGKTTLALHAIAARQRMGGAVAFLDVERALDKRYAASLGINLEELIFSEPASAEEAFDIAGVLIDSGSVSLIAIDSIAALLPKNSELFEERDSTAIENARMLAAGFSKLRSKLKGRQCTVIFTNQLRMRQKSREGEFSLESFGGRPVLNFMATRVLLTKGNDISINYQIAGHHCHMFVKKHKDGHSGGHASTPLIHRKGFALSYQTLSTGIKTGLVKRTSSGYIAGNTWLGHNGVMAKINLDRRPNLRLKLNLALIREQFRKSCQNECSPNMSC